MDQKLHKLYQSTILEHGHDPKNFGKLHKYEQFAEGLNPLCKKHMKITQIINEMIKMLIK